MKTCKWCGKKYEACHTPNPERVFRWKDIACTKECAAAYIAKVEGVRSAAAEKIAGPEAEVKYYAEVTCEQEASHVIDASSSLDVVDYDVSYEDDEEEDYDEDELSDDADEK